MNILYHIIRIILSVGTILILIRNEDIYQAHKHTHPTNKIRYIISQLLTPNNIHHSPDNIIPHIKVPGINTGYLPHTPTQKIKQNHTNANYVT